MAITFRQITNSVSASSPVSLTATFGANIAAGNFIYVCAFNSGTAPTLTITDNTSGVFTDTGIVITGFKLGAFFTPTSSTNAVTVTFGGTTGTFGALFIYEIAGINDPVFDKIVAASGNSASADSGTTGPLSQAAEAAVAFIIAVNSPTSPGAGWSIGQGTLTTGNNGDGGAGISIGEHQITTVNTALHGTATVNTGQWVATCVTMMPFISSSFSDTSRDNASVYTRVPLMVPYS